VRGFEKRLTVILLALAVLLPGGAERAWADEEYVLGSEDVVSVEVWQRPELSTQARIDFNGNITLPAVGQVKVAGRTPEEASAELTRRFRLIDRNIAEVLVRVVEYNHRKLFMMGEVVKPGKYSFARVPSVWEAIREAGGATSMGDLSKVKVVRGEGRGRQTLEVNVKAALDKGDVSSLEILKPGDTILIPRLEAIEAQEDVVYIFGAVRAPGIYPIKSAGTLVAAILSAGGFLPDADPSRVQVVRGDRSYGITLGIDLDRYLRSGDRPLNPRLVAGDTITVPRKTGSGIRRVISSVSSLTSFLSAIASVLVIYSAIG